MPANCHPRFSSSLSVSPCSPHRTCKGPQCAPFFQECEDSVDTPLQPLQSAKCLGSFITPTSSSVPDVTSSSVPDVNFRCSQASSAFKTLDPFFRHPLISQKFKLRVYTQIMQAILLHGSESQVYSPAQISKIDSLHYKALRQIFKIKSPYFHRVLLPSDSLCSNEYLLSLLYPVSTCIPSSLHISDSRTKCLGHIHRHPSSPESIIMFNPSFSLRTISSPFRRGASRAHWPELSLAEASHLLGQFHHEFYRFFIVVELKSFLAVSMKQWYDTTRVLRVLLPLAKIGNNGSSLPQKWNRQPILGTLLRTCSSIWATYRFWKKMRGTAPFGNQTWQSKFPSIQYMFLLSLDNFVHGHSKPVKW